MKCAWEGTDPSLDGARIREGFLEEVLWRQWLRLLLPFLLCPGALPTPLARIYFPLILTLLPAWQKAILLKVDTFGFFEGGV